MYVNAANTSIVWSSLREGEWMHVHLEASYAFSDDVNVFSRVASGAGMFRV
jgi:hypothetical protein